MTPHAFGGFALDTDAEVAHLIGRGIDKLDLTVDPGVQVASSGVPVVTHFPNADVDESHPRAPDP